jgi:hypothetical protein
VIAAPALGAAAERLARELDLPEPFHDPGVGEFGLENAVFPVGDAFLEVVAPLSGKTTSADTAAGRYLARRGSPEAAGYMAIFQFADGHGLAAARQRAKDNGIRIVWQADLPDIAGTHLHPADVPGAIVSLDWADPPESWHWAGPRWRGQADPQREPGGIGGIVVAVEDPARADAVWSAVLGQPAKTAGVEFTTATDPTATGIVEISLGRATGTTRLAIGSVAITTTGPADEHASGGR